jgi:catechol 2,3-dioxygenase-like lactoylglutathione lyase family enzyme
VIRVQGVHHVKVPVTDLTRSRSWYESVLPLTPQLEFPDEAGTVRGVVFAAPGGLTLSLREDAPRARALAGFNPFAVLVSTRADLDEVGRHLDGIGLKHGPVVTATLGWLLTVPDPDGIILSFYTAEQHTGQDISSPGQGSVVLPSSR